VKKILYLIFSLSVTAGVFYYLLSEISISDVLKLISNVDRHGLLLFVTCSLAMSFFITWRYKLLISVSGFSPSPVLLFLVVLVRNLFADLLPARIGTFVYIYIVNSRLGVALSAATSSFVLATLLDILALMILLIVLVGVGFDALPPAYLLAFAILIGGIIWVVIYNLPRLLNWLVQILPKSPTMEKLTVLFSSIEREVTASRQAGVFTRLIALSLLVRITKYAALYFFLYALLRPLAYTFSDLNVSKVLVGLVAAESSASLPVSGIAGFGAYEGVWAFTFEFLGFPGKIAQLTAISHHLFTQLYGYSIGALALMLLLLPIASRARVTNVANYDEKASSFYLKILLSVVLLALVLAAFLGSLPAQSGAKSLDNHNPVLLSKKEKAALENLGSKLPRRILFDSNRSGTFGIYSIRVDGTELMTLADGKQHEMYPSVSPDGRWIVYASARSTARHAPAEIWIMDINGNGNRLVAADGTFPSFSSAGNSIYFERDRSKVMSVKLDGSQMKEIYPANTKPFRNHAVVKPRISPDGTMVAFTSDRRGRWNAWYDRLDGSSPVHISKGCEPNWHPNGKELVLVLSRAKNAKAKSGLFDYHLASKAISVSQDDGPPFGHEYFPALSSNGKFLLYSAAPADQHDHFSANYQIYLKDLESGTTTRITFDNHTNRWPTLLP